MKRHCLSSVAVAPVLALGLGLLISLVAAEFPLALPSAQAASVPPSSNDTREDLFPWPDLSRPPQSPEVSSKDGLKKGEQKPGKQDAALVVGISDYAFAPDISGAVENAEAWWSFLRKRRGIDLERAVLLRNQEASLEGILEAAAKVASLVEDRGTAWFIFVGHGVSSEDGEEGMAVGMDAQRNLKSLMARSIRLSDLEAIFENSRASHVVFLADSCFSGLTPSGESFVPGLQPLIFPSKTGTKPRSKIIRMTAGHRDQFAGQLPHGEKPAFSYLTLGALRGWGDENGDGQVTAKEAVDYATLVLGVVEKGRRQTPELVAHEEGENFPLSVGEKELGPDLDALVLFQGSASSNAPAPLEKNRPEIQPASGVNLKPVSMADSPSVGVRPKVKSGPIHLIQFVDYESGACAKVEPKVQKLLGKLGPSRVMRYVRHCPSPSHANGSLAAEAVLCANEQGKFSQMHGALLKANRRPLNQRKIMSVARGQRLFMKPFESCLNSKRYAQAVKRDAEEAWKMGIRKTPTFLVDGQFVDFNDLKLVLDRAQKSPSWHR